MKRELKYVHIKKSRSNTEISVLEKTEEDLDYKHLEKNSDADELIGEIAEAQQLLKACEALSGELQAPEKEEREGSTRLPAAQQR